MKKLKYISLSLIVAMVMFSCSKKLDVQPQNNVTPDQIQTSDDVIALMLGGYGQLQNPNAFGERFQFIADLLASQDEIDFIGTFTNYADIQSKTTIENNSIASGIWINSYALINSMNTVLDKIDIVDEDLRDATAAEAKFMRGITYFELVNFYSQPYSVGNTTAANSGVPIILQPTYAYDSTVKPSRNTIEEVYQQVITDLTDASNNLPTSAQDGRATKYAAEAFLSRVYMQMHNYEEAATMADDVINSGNYFLVSDYSKAFNNDGYSTEDIFGILQSSQSNAGTNNNGLPTFYAALPVGRGDAQVNAGYFDYFSGNDQRAAFFYDGGSIGGFSGTYTGKYSTLYKTIPVVRIAEMYLTRGEANLRKGGEPVGGVAPDDDINVVRSARSADLISDATGLDFVDERFRELAFEGDRVWTRKRLKLQIDGLSYDDPMLVLPIPQREMDVNKNLVQNAGY
jgi:tetratricopeptide (TPR) repeat protein